MDLQFVCVHPGPAAQAIVLFCILWPFVTLLFLRSRTTSSAPLSAMLLPMAVAVMGIWIGFYNVVTGMSVSGNNGRLASAAGIAEALMILSIGACSAMLVAFFALIRRHRPVADRVTMALAAAVIIEVIAALMFGARIKPLDTQMTLALVWAATALVFALAIAVWLILVLCGRVVSQPIRFGMPAIAIVYAVMAVVVYREVHRYIDIALHG
jgi:hypothetical protein